MRVRPAGTGRMLELDLTPRLGMFLMSSRPDWGSSAGRGCPYDRPGVYIRDGRGRTSSQPPLQHWCPSCHRCPSGSCLPHRCNLDPTHRSPLDIYDWITKHWETLKTETRLFLSLSGILESRLRLTQYFWLGSYSCSKIIWSGISANLDCAEPFL